MSEEVVEFDEAASSKRKLGDGDAAKGEIASDAKKAKIEEGASGGSTGGGVPSAAPSAVDTFFDGTFNLCTTAEQEARLDAPYQAKIAAKKVEIAARKRKTGKIQKYTAYAYFSKEPREFHLINGQWSLLLIDGTLESVTSMIDPSSIQTTLTPPRRAGGGKCYCVGPLPVSDGLRTRIRDGARDQTVKAVFENQCGFNGPCANLWYCELTAGKAAEILGNDPNDYENW